MSVVECGCVHSGSAGRRDWPSFWHGFLQACPWSGRKRPPHGQSGAFCIPLSHPSGRAVALPRAQPPQGPAQRAKLIDEIAASWDHGLQRSAASKAASGAEGSSMHRERGQHCRIVGGVPVDVVVAGASRRPGAKTAGRRSSTRRLAHGPKMDLGLCTTYAARRRAAWRALASELSRSRKS